MKLDGRRKSTQVDDRRGKKPTSALGCGGIIIVGLIIWLMGGDPMSFLMNEGINSVTSTTEGNYVSNEEEEQLADFSKMIFAGTEDVWTEIFRQKGWGEYVKPQMVLFSGSVHSGCGNATSDRKSTRLNSSHT